MHGICRKMYRVSACLVVLINKWNLALNAGCKIYSTDITSLNTIYHVREMSSILLTFCYRFLFAAISKSGAGQLDLLIIDTLYKVVEIYFHQFICSFFLCEISPPSFWCFLLHGSPAIPWHLLLCKVPPLSFWCFLLHGSPVIQWHLLPFILFLFFSSPRPQSFHVSRSWNSFFCHFGLLVLLM